MKRTRLRMRAHILALIREFFSGQGFLEVETPFRIPANAPEIYIDPLSSEAWQLQTSPEICMKRLLCRGYGKIFQISKCWRNGERGNRHLTEFTILEWYRSDADYENLMKDCEDLLHFLGEGFPEYQTHNSGKWDTSLPPVRISLQDAFLRFSRIEMFEALKNDRFDEIIATVIEPELETYREPVLLYDFPSETSSLSKRSPGNPALAERFELYLGGMELANGFSELVDPLEQRARFDEANSVRTANGAMPVPIPEKFLAELGSMPPAAGIALGVDRLVMLLTGAQKIDDVVAFAPDEL